MKVPLSSERSGNEPRKRPSHSPENLGDYKPEGRGLHLVDQDGKRFSSEKMDGHCQLYVASHFDAIAHRYPRIPCYMIFDQRTVDAGSFGSSLGSGYAINRKGHCWSKGLIKEVEMGLIKKTGSIRELADLINGKSRSAFGYICW